MRERDATPAGGRRETGRRRSRWPGAINSARGPLGWLGSLCLLAAVGQSVAAGESSYLKLEAGIHFDTDISSRELVLSVLGIPIWRKRDDTGPTGLDMFGIAQAAKRRLDVIIVTDRDNAVVEYGLTRYSRLFKVRCEMGSIRKYGATKYLRRLSDLQHTYPGLIVVPGAEAVPFYYWRGGLFGGEGDGEIELHRLYEHLLVLGLTEPSDYSGLPSVGAGFPYRFSFSFLLVLPVIVAWVIGYRCFRRVGKKRIQYGNFVFAVDIRPRRALGVVLMVISTLVLIDGFPFLPRKFCQYDGDQGIEPYQLLIDYVDQKGGLVFWAHPDQIEEEHTRGKFGVGVTTKKAPYSHHVRATKNHSGFAIFYEGMRGTGYRGGLWDQTLRDYCNGRRERPIWAIGELDFENSPDLNLIRDCITTVLATERSRDAVLEALRKGRMYVTRDRAADQIRLDEFYITSPLEEGRRAVSGEEVSAAEEVTVHLRLVWRMPKTEAVGLRRYEVWLVRDGRIIKEFRCDDDSPFEVEVDYVDDPREAEGTKTYYRLVAAASGHVKLVSNPIFVSIQGR